MAGRQRGQHGGCRGGRKAAVPVPIPIPQWGLFWRLRAGCGPADSAPDSHPCRLGGSRRRATAPASLPTALGRGTGTGGDPLPVWDPPTPQSPSGSLRNSPAGKIPAIGRAPAGPGERLLPKAGGSLPPELAFPGEELQQSEAFALSDHIYLNIFFLCVCSKIGYRINTCAL